MPAGPRKRNTATIRTEALRLPARPQPTAMNLPAGNSMWLGSTTIALDTTAWSRVQPTAALRSLVVNPQTVVGDRRMTSPKETLEKLSQSVKLAPGLSTEELLSLE